MTSLDAVRTAPTGRGADPESAMSELPAAAGAGYAGEWGLFCDYTAATGQPALPTTVVALSGFLAALPARPSTVARRVRAIAAAHRHAGYLLERPDFGLGALPAIPARTGPDPGLMIAACPTRGWPGGLWGRRDAFLIVLTEVLGYARPAARELRPDDISMATLVATGETVPHLRGRPVPGDEDPRRCAACAVVRWLDVLGVADGLGRGTARMDLTAAHAPTATSPHRHQPSQPTRWSGAPVLLPGIDRHGWHDDYRPMTARALRTRLALAAGRLVADEPDDGAAVTASSAQLDRALTEAGPARAPRELDEVLTMLDDLADDADALNARIQALLSEHTR